MAEQYPKRGVAWQTSISLGSVADAGEIQISPTLAAGDVSVSLDGGALANIATLPSESPAGSGLLSVSLSDAEMTADVLVVRFRDQTDPAEWQDLTLTVPTLTRKPEDLAFPVSSGNGLAVSALGVADADVQSWATVAVKVSAAQQLPAVDAESISDSTTAADDVETNIANLDAAVSTRSTFDATTDAVDIDPDQSAVTVGTVTTVTNPVEISATGAILVADAVLIRDFSVVESTANQYSLGALIAGSFLFDTSAPGLLTTYRTDKTTVLYTYPLDSDPLADNLTEIK